MHVQLLASNILNKLEIWIFAAQKPHDCTFLREGYVSKRTTWAASCHIQTKPRGGDCAQHTSRPRQAERQVRRENVNNMPESSGERETEAGTGRRQQREKGNQSSRNIVSVMSEFADDNLTLVRVGVSFVRRQWTAEWWWRMGTTVPHGPQCRNLPDTPGPKCKLKCCEEEFPPQITRPVSHHHQSPLCRLSVQHTLVWVDHSPCSLVFAHRT